jgi:hypothetical protein
LYGDSYAAFLSSFSPSAYGVSAYGDPVVAGSAGDANEVVELLSDGELNTSFGSSGVVTLPFYPTSVTVMDHGQLYVGGSADGIPGILVRLNPDGSLDTTFGLNGYSQQRKRTGTRGGMTPWVYSPWQRADINNGAPIVTNPNPLTTDITFTPRGAYPYIPLAPTIGYDITFEFTTNAARTTFKVSLFGDRTKFPDGEGYIDRHVVYQDPSWWSGPNFYNVNSFKTFSVGPLTIDPLQN